MANDSVQSVSRETARVADQEAGRRRVRRSESAGKIGSHDWDVLRRFMTEHGKIMPARLTGVSAKQQRKIARLIRRLRVVGLLP